MKIYLTLILLSISQLSRGETNDRLVFFPDVKSYIKTEIALENMRIRLPKNGVKKEQINDYSTIGSFKYGHKVKKNFFLSLEGLYEEATESKVRHGVEENGKYKTRGLKDPNFSILQKLRDEDEFKGALFYELSFSPQIGVSKKGASGENRFMGGEVFKLELSNLKKEDKWDFKSSFRFERYFSAVTKNTSLDEKVKTDGQSNFYYIFTTQYELSQIDFASVGLGFTYQGDKTFKYEKAGKKEIQAGTGSLFRFGYTRLLKDQKILKAKFHIDHNEYFLKGVQENYNGTGTIYSLSLAFIKNF